ncbi:FtsX-like permease family protein [Corynebacterium mendelii]|uniref:ABC transporter permease n=1 Tax=Corynebacterium mendelii TaxID=2765362 RepID=A0A939DYM6_9CORY|nr:ABC transporter permease [Corynebacterium mendelii]MBN9643256.1 ABC transporter permease [Corynebacterium mendelii]
MFLALKDIRAAKARFALITVTVAMMALLVSFLSGLTGGLTHQTISSLSALGGRAAILEGTSSPSLDRSRLSTAVTDDLIAANPQSTAVSFSRTRVGGADLAVVSVAAGHNGPADHATYMPAAGEAAVSSAAQTATGLSVGDTLTIRGQQLTVAAITGDDWFNHSPVIWTHLEPGTEAAAVITAAADPAITGDTQTVAAGELPATLAAHQAESTSLGIISAMLLMITALVTGAFFLVWTVQRTGDIATLKALGATTSSLIADSLGQATVILATGIGAGLAVTVATATAIGDSLPFVLNGSTTVLPAVTMFALGLAGAAAALLFLRTTSPLTALGGNR